MLYESQSKGPIEIQDMESTHLDNTIKKFENKKAQGEAIPEQLLSALKEEQLKRTTQTTQPSLQGEAIKDKQDVEPSQVLPDYLESFAEAVQHGAHVLAPVSPALAHLTRQLAERLTAYRIAVLKKRDTLGPTISPDSFLTDLSGDREATYLTVPLLVNSLSRNYNVRTVRELSYLCPADFAAVRYAVPEAMLDADRILRRAGLNWASTSSILAADGRINRNWNPNAAPIESFISSANTQIEELLGRLRCNPNYQGTREDVAVELACLFQGVKRRINLAVSVLGTYLLARGADETAVLEVLRTDVVPGLRLSLAFNDQLLRYWNKMRKVADSHPFE